MQTKPKESGFFKVNGWGCDALDLKTNVTMVRTDANGDPTNQGAYIRVKTTSKDFWFRYQSGAEETWKHVPPQQKALFPIPTGMMGHKSIEVEAQYYGF